MSMAELERLLAAQRPNGAFASTVAIGMDRFEDHTCFVTASVALLLHDVSTSGRAERARLAHAGERALDFVEACESPQMPGAFCFYPRDARSPRVVHGLPPDADDTAVAWLALLAVGRRSVSAARSAFGACIAPASRQLVPGDAPWLRPGAVRTFLLEQGSHNPFDLVVNANVAALAERIGERDHPAAVGARASLRAAARGRYDPARLGRRLTPFYASSACELRIAVARAIAFGATELAPVMDWLAPRPGDDDPLREDKALYCNDHGQPIWRAPCLQQARRLAAAWLGGETIPQHQELEGTS
jgi:hypothetical protein